MGPDHYESKIRRNQNVVGRAPAEIQQKVIANINWARNLADRLHNLDYQQRDQAIANIIKVMDEDYVAMGYSLADKTDHSLPEKVDQHLQALMAEYNAILQASSPALQQAIVNANRGVGVIVPPEEIETYKKLRWYSSVIQRENAYLQLLNSYEQMMAQASPALRDAIGNARNGYAITIPSEEMDLYQQLRAIDTRISSATPEIEQLMASEDLDLGGR